MIASVSVRVDHREVHRSHKPRKIGNVTEATTAVLKELDAAPNSAMDWTRIVITIDREDV